MRITTFQMYKKLKELFDEELFLMTYNRDKNTFRIEWKDSKQGITVSLPNIVAKYQEEGQSAIDELEEHLKEALRVMNEQYDLDGKEKHIFPVIRSTSFPVKTKSGKKLVTKDHTAETRIFYALDLGKSYQLIDESLLEKEGWSKEQIDEIASFNVRSLRTEPKKDTVRGNDYYFIATQDGYDASRILNDAFLEEMKAKCKGEMAVAVPHQDVLIVADIQNSTGYDILAHMTMKFFTEGRIPITSLSFIYEDRKLEPIFILAKNKPTD